MHWWNLIKSARLCSQCDFECHAGWSGHNAYIRVALVEDDLNRHTVWHWNRIIRPEATMLQSVDIQGWSRTGVNNTNIRNIVLIDHWGTPERGGAGWAPATDGWRNRWCMETFRAAHTRKQCWAYTHFSHKSAWLALINKIMNCRHWLTFHT